VLGVDISEEMIRLARRTAPAARFQRASLHTIDVPSCVAVTATGECLNYTFDPVAGEPAMSRLFARVRAALDRRGVFLFDVAVPGRLGETGVREVIHDTDDWTLWVRMREDTEAHWLVRQTTTFSRYGGHYERSDETHVLRLFPPAEVETRLAEAGLRARRLHGYGARPLGPGWLAYLAEPADR
jgi:hypothetical protein